MRKYRVVWAGYWSTDVEAETEQKARELARSLNEFRSDDGRFPVAILWVEDLTEQEQRKAVEHEAPQ